MYLYYTFYILYIIYIFILTILEEEVLIVFLHICTDNRFLVTQHQEIACATSHSFIHECHRKDKTMLEWSEFNLLTFQEFFSCNRAENTILNQDFIIFVLVTAVRTYIYNVMITQEK